MRDINLKLLAVPAILALLAMAACSNGGTVVTMTATASSDPFILYRVGLASVELKTSSGKTAIILPTETTVDFTKTFDLGELLGATTIPKGNYVGAVITLDYSTAQIIYDDGSADGVALLPVDAKGNAFGLVSVGVALDPGDPIRSAAKEVGRLSLNFNLAASNLINLSKNTVTITPLIAASAQPIDTKQVRIRGPLLGASGFFLTSGLMPFESTAAGTGQLSIESSDTTAYEINGFVSTGATGMAQLETLPGNTLVTTFGTLTITSTAANTTPTTPATTPTTPTTPTGTTTSSVTFAASQVLVDGAVQGAALGQVSGTVSARSGNTLGLEDATLIQAGGTVTFLPGTTIVNVGPNTLVTFFGQGVVSSAITSQDISIGSVIEAFGTESNTSTGQILLDASAGRVRLDLTSAAGFVTAQGSQSLTLNLTTLGGRAISAFDFIGSGAAANQYGVSTGTLDLTNSIAGAPVIVTGFPNLFATPAPNFTATTLLDPTTIQAELVLDWNGGTAAPFASFDSSAIVVDVANTSIGLRHQIQIGSDIVNLVGLSSNPSITPATSSSTAGTVYSIGHASSFTVENFESYGAFISQLQSELNGSTLATGMTALGLYTASTLAFSATSITLFLND